MPSARLECSSEHVNLPAHGARVFPRHAARAAPVPCDPAIRRAVRAPALPPVPPLALPLVPPLALPTAQPPVQALFRADWIDAVMIHFAVPRRVLQPSVPFELDTLDGDAFVSLVAFGQRRLRWAWHAGGDGSPRAGGPTAVGAQIANACLRPLAAHDFLNLRTYVRHRGEAGIYFLAEVLNSRLAVALGPLLYGLPYRFGRVAYRNDLNAVDFASGEVLEGRVVDAATGRALAYRGRLEGSLPAEGAAGLPA
ncbi:MAG: DUF2071 domain-containing protein, partial [Rhodanobacteraceae bacterium]